MSGVVSRSSSVWVRHTAAFRAAFADTRFDQRSPARRNRPSFFALDSPFSIMHWYAFVIEPSYFSGAVCIRVLITSIGVATPCEIAALWGGGGKEARASKEAQRWATRREGGSDVCEGWKEGGTVIRTLNRTAWKAGGTSMDDAGPEGQQLTSPPARKGAGICVASMIPTIPEREEANGAGFSGGWDNVGGCAGGDMKSDRRRPDNHSHAVTLCCVCRG